MKTEQKEEYIKLKEQRKSQIKRQNNFISANYKRKTITIPNDIYNSIISKYGNISINGYINELIKKDLG